MEHTNEFLQGMFAAYMGCKCEITEIQDGTTKKIKSKMSGIVSERLHFDETGLFVHFSKIKLILTQLSEISDNDAIEVAKIAQCRYQAIESIIIAGRELVTIYMNRQTNVSALSWSHIIDYLRKKKYDCGYLHISSLIEAGLAVKATK